MEQKNFNYTPELYDLQVNWSKRLEKEKFFFIGIFKQRKVTNLLDIGCGTGHHAQFFSDYVERITAVDPSDETIDYARKNVIKSKNIELLRGGFEDLERLVAGKYDLIVCLGNTLPLLGNRRNVKLALKNTRKKLVDGGLAIFQFLNFEPKIIEKNSYYQPKIFIKDNKKYIFMKHFEYGKVKTRADFIITVLDTQDKVENFYINSSNFCTLRKKLFLKMAENSGFKKIDLLNTDGNEMFDSKKHISLYALLYR
jgi:ubiquinone/menaquinone biosynthesis C-methylase UbiE